MNRSTPSARANNAGKRNSKAEPWKIADDSARALAVVESIRDGWGPRHLQWFGSSTVRVLGNVIPPRRKRFCALLTKLLAVYGWVPLPGAYGATYTRADSAPPTLDDCGNPCPRRWQTPTPPPPPPPTSSPLPLTFREAAPITREPGEFVAPSPRRESPYMTIAEAAAYVRQKVKTLDNWTRKGEVVFISTPRGKLFTAEALDRLMQAKTYPPRSQR